MQLRLLHRLFATTILLGSATAAHAHGTEHGKSVTLTGEVMDLACYVQHPDSGQGPEHAACAKQCINKGLPAGLKADGKLYLLMAPGHDSLVDTIAPLAGTRATVTGRVIERDGLRAFIVEKAGRAP